MINTVVKKSGDRETFSEDKLKKSIMAACIDADIPEDRTRELVLGVAEKMMNNFEGKDEITTSELRDAVVAALEDMESSAAEAWRKFESSKN